MAPDNRPKYSMAMVRKMTGLTDRQIRYYEEVGLVHPARTRGKQRIFSKAEVERLRKIKELIGQGLNMEGVKEVMAKERDHDLVALKPQLSKGVGGARARITSLYPVSNRAQLVQMVVQRRRERERERDQNKKSTEDQ